jgi:hypothetical protein
MRTVERQNLAKVRHLLTARGVKNTSKLDYHEAIQTLARRVAEECGGHRMRETATGHRLTTAGIAGDTRSEPFSEHTPLSTHKPDTKLEGGNARAK